MSTTHAIKDTGAPAHAAGRENKDPEAIGRPVASFGLSFAVAVLATAVIFAIKAAEPELDEWAEEAFGHAWFYQAVLALVLFFGLGFIPMGGRLGGRGVAAIVIGSTVASGLIILAAAAALALG